MVIFRSCCLFNKHWIIEYIRWVSTTTTTKNATYQIRLLYPVRSPVCASFTAFCFALKNYIKSKITSGTTKMWQHIFFQIYYTNSMLQMMSISYSMKFLSQYLHQIPGCVYWQQSLTVNESTTTKNMLNSRWVCLLMISFHGIGIRSVWLPKKMWIYKNVHHNFFFSAWVIY